MYAGIAAVVGWPVVAWVTSPGPTTELCAGVARLLIEAGALWYAAGRRDLPRRARIALYGLGGISCVSAVSIVVMDISRSEAWSLTWYLASYALGAAFLLVWPQVAVRRWHVVSLVIDTVVVAGGIGVLLWVYAVHPLPAGPGRNQAWIEVLAQITQVAALSAVVLRGAAVPSRRAYSWFLFGQLAYVPSLALPLFAETSSAWAPIDTFVYFALVGFTVRAAVLFRREPLVRSPTTWVSEAWLDVNPLALATPLFLGVDLIVALIRDTHPQIEAIAAALALIAPLMAVRTTRSVVAALRLSRARAHAEQQLTRGRAEVVGRLAGGIAHEFNNLMASILGHAELAQQDLPPDAPVRADLEGITAAGTRAAALTAKLLQYSGRQFRRRARLDVAGLVDALAPRLRATVGDAIAVTVTSTPVEAEVDRTQFEQLVLELAANARQAMPDGGRLLVQVGPIDLATPIATATSTVAPGSYLELVVEDTGTGIAPEALPHIFEPFFSTRPLPVASGLGLAAVHGIVTTHGGTIEVASSPGRGARFRVLVPRFGAVTDASG